MPRTAANRLNGTNNRRFPTSASEKEMEIEFYLRVTEEALPALIPALEAAGAIPSHDIACIEWENPVRKMAVYQVVTGDNLDHMAEEFNRFLEKQRHSHRLRDTSTMDTPSRYKALHLLANNATWYRDGEMQDSWLDGDPKETQRILAKYQDILEEAGPH